MENQENQEVVVKKSSKKPIIIISVIAVIIVAILVTVIVFLLPKEGNESKAGVKRGMVATSDNIAQVKEEMKVKSGNYNTTMNTEWKFNSSTEPSLNAYVQNSARNKDTVYFDVNLTDVSMKEEGELIYSSPYLPVGSEIGPDTEEKIALTKKLAPGVYNAIVTYHMVDAENDNADTGRTVSVSIKIHVSK